jgi:hypothetical protein
MVVIGALLGMAGVQLGVVEKEVLLAWTATAGRVNGGSGWG